MPQPVAKIPWWALVKNFINQILKMKNYSPNLGEKYISRLANVFKIDEISHQPGDQISW